MNILWTDGSSGKSGKIGWSIVGQLQHLTDPVRCYGHGRGTNQTAELTAAIEALRLVPDQVDVTIITDSQYVIKAATIWRKTWERSNYVNWQGLPLSNKEMILALHRECDRVKATFVHVRGHTGDDGNELADAMAHLARRIMEGRVDPIELAGYNLIRSFNHEEANYKDQAGGSSEAEDSSATAGQEPRGQEEVLSPEAQAGHSQEDRGS